MATEGPPIDALGARKSVVAAAYLLLLTALAALYFSNLRPVIAWGDDWALYTSHARNIANGSPYLEIGLVYDQSTAENTPSSSPPVFPFVLSVGYRLFGLNIAALKGVVIIVQLCAIAAIACYFHGIVGLWPALLIAGLTGICFPLLYQVDGILPHSTSLLLTYVYLALHGKLERSGAATQRPVVTAGILAAVAVVSVFTRMAGLAVVGATVVHWLWRRRRVTSFLVWYLAFFAAAYLMGSHLFPGGNSYFDQMSLSPLRYLTQVVVYSQAMSYIWVNNFSQPIRLVSYVLTLILVAYSAKERLRQGPTLLDWFVLAHFGILIGYTAGAGVYYAIPIIPAVFYYSFDGLRRAARTLPSAPARALVFVWSASGLVLVFAAVFLFSHRSVDDGPHRPSYQALLGFVKEHVQPQSRVVLWKPRAFTLLSGRPAGFFVHTDDPSRFVENLAERRIDYVVLFKGEEVNQRWLAPNLAKRQRLFTVVYENADFRLLRYDGSARPERRTWPGQ